MAEPVVEQSRVVVYQVPESPRAQTDLLIVVDDTLAIEPYREQLAALPYQFAHRLSWYTQRWIDLRVAVTGNDGRLRRLPGADEPWLSEAFDFDYTRRTNYTGTLGDNLAMLMNVDHARFGPNQPLEAARRALETSSQFVRDPSGLMILTISAGDDASPLAVADYVSWLRRAVDGAWPRDRLLSGIYPKGSPRLDEYYKAMQPHAIVSSIEDGYYEEALPWVPGDPWPVSRCLDGLDLDPATSELEHDCAMLANVSSRWHTIPECTSAENVERTEREIRSEPSPPCWWLHRNLTECGSSRDSSVLELSGYTRTQHPELRFDCRTK